MAEYTDPPPPRLTDAERLARCRETVIGQGLSMRAMGDELRARDEALLEASRRVVQLEAAVGDQPEASAARFAFLACALYDATMEGPRFRAWDRSALDRLRRRYEDEGAPSPAEKPSGERR